MTTVVRYGTGIAYIAQRMFHASHSHRLLPAPAATAVAHTDGHVEPWLLQPDIATTTKHVIARITELLTKLMTQGLAANDIAVLVPSTMGRQIGHVFGTAVADSGIPFAGAIHYLSPDKADVLIDPAKLLVAKHYDFRGLDRPYIIFVPPSLDLVDSKYGDERAIELTIGFTRATVAVYVVATQPVYDLLVTGDVAVLQHKLTTDPSSASTRGASSRAPLFASVGRPRSGVGPVRSPTATVAPRPRTAAVI